MQNDGVKTIVCDAEESDWLDISYAERNYVSKDNGQGKKSKIGKGIKILAVALAIVAILGALLFVDGNFRTEVFATAKTVYSQVLAVFDKQQGQSNVITLPSNVDLMDSADGVSTFGGGRAILSFTDGVVTSISESSVTVALDQDTSITYEGFTSVMVTVGDSVSAGGLLGKYDGSFTTVIAENGAVVTQVVASETQLTWQV